MSSFCTILSNSDRASIFKDPCTIPVKIAKYGYESSFVSFIDISNLTPEEKEYTKDIRLVQLKNDLCGKSTSWKSWSIIKYIWQNAKKIDILNLFYLKYSILYGILYKILNPYGFFYLKLDLDGYGEKKLDERPFQFFRRYVFRHYLRNVPNLVSVESTFSYDYIKESYLSKSDKLKLVYNGIDISDETTILEFEDRENIILVVGRIGAKEKNHELILQAAALVEDWKDWKICFIGPVEQIFSAYTDEFLTNHKNLRNHLEFLGAIYNRKKLFSFYNRSKVLCMTSNYESFGFVFAESQYFGNYILSTEVSSLYDFIENNQLLGLRVTDSISLSSAIKNVIDGELKLSEGFDERISHGKRFLWKTIIDDLVKYLDK